MRKSGLTTEETYANVNKLKKTCNIVFTVDSLGHLYKGGRVGKLTSVAGNFLSIKPMIHFHNAKVDLLGNVRGHKHWTYSYWFSLY